MSQSNHCGMEIVVILLSGEKLGMGLNRTIVEWKSSNPASFTMLGNMSQSNHCGMEIRFGEPAFSFCEARLNRTIVEWKFDQDVASGLIIITSQSNHCGMEIGAGNGSPKPEAGSLGLVER